MNNNNMSLNIENLSPAPHIIRETCNGHDVVRIEDALLQSREIFLTDRVDSHSMESLLKQLLFLSREDPGEEITLYINSPGGSVDSGLAVYDYMRLIPSPIRTVCIGMAASMAAILFLAGDQRIMFPNAQVMIHDPSLGGGLAPGIKPDEMEEALESLKKIRNVSVGIISSVTGMTKEEVMDKTRKDSYFNAEEAVASGLATEILNTDTIGQFTAPKGGRYYE